MTNRRDFLRTVAMSAPILARVTAVQHAFASDLSALRLGSLAGGSFAQLRTEYMLAPGVTYLNHAAIGTIPRPVHAAHVRYLEVCESDPWLYMWGGEWDAPREAVRRKAAGLLGCDVAEVAITHNTTEAFNVLANGLPLGPGDEVLCSSLNHDGATIPFYHAARVRGFAVTRFDFPLVDAPKLRSEDVVDIYERHVTARTRLLVFPHVDNILGIRYPARAMAAMARSRGVDYVAVDAAQSVGMIPLDAHGMAADLIATSPHKWLQAPKGLGLAYVSQGIQEALRPLWVRTSQERLRGSARIYEDYGTRNLPEVLTLGDAIDFQSQIDGEQRARRLQALRQFARDACDRHPRTSWASPEDWESSSSLYAVSVQGRPVNELARTMFTEAGVVFRPFTTGGLNAARLSPNVFTTEDEISRFFSLV